MARTPNTPVRPAVAGKTDVRNSPIPKQTQQRPASPTGSSTPRQVTHDAIARKAYEIWQSGQGGSEFDNWVRAERELRGR